jgi:REP element-mobilizing transposase RayT
MTLFCRRRLPHWVPDKTIVFVTWRLADPGPLWLQDPRIAGVVSQALKHGETVRRLYALHAWVIMPNHVHAILESRIALPDIMRWLKGRTSRVANRILGRTGKPFWQDESFDHWIRSGEELRELIAYVEEGPAKAGLAEARDEWPWTSARIAADDKRRSSAPQWPQ